MMKLMTVPFNELDKIYRQIDRAFDDSSHSTWHRSIYPPIELKESADTLVLRAMLPGIARDRLTIEVTREAVLISGTYPEPDLPDKSQYFQSEFPQGPFRRAIPLPLAVDNTAVTAKYEHGILTLTLPKAPEVINKVVKISVLDSIQQKSDLNSTVSEGYDDAKANDVESVDNPWDA